MTEVAKKPKISVERKPGTIHAFFALKYHEGDKDRAKLEAIKEALNMAGVTITSMVQDVEKWGKAVIPEGKKLMTDYAFPSMDECDCNIIEFSEKGVGLGMNAGYFLARKKPIYVIAKTGSDISTTMANVATKIIFYDDPKDLIEPFKEIVNNFPRVILASKSAIRKQQMIEAKIPFEVMVSNADETPDTTKSFRDQLAEISMRKAKTVFEKTKERGLRLIVAADQNVVFDGKMYGKPKNIDQARDLICQMIGSEEVYFYTGNAILLCKGDEILQSINVTDTAKARIDNLSKEEIERYLKNDECLSVCGGISLNCSFVHLEEGRMSTAKGMTMEYVKEMTKQL